MKKLSLVLAMVMLICTLFATPVMAEEDDEIIVGFCPYRMSGGTFSHKLTISMSNYCSDRGWRYEAVESRGETEPFLQSVETWIQMGADFIAAHWIDEAVAQTVQEICDEAGIPFILMGCEPEGVAVISADNAEFGRIAGVKTAEAVIERWGGEVDALVTIEMPEGGKLNNVRMDAATESFLATLGKTEEEVEVVVVADVRGQTTETQQAVTDVLSTHPDWDKIAFIAYECPNTFLPACNAIISEGLMDNSLITMVQGFDEPAYYMMADYDFVVGIGEHFSDSFADVAFELMENHLAGEEIERKIYYVPHTWVDHNNMNEVSYDLPEER